MKNLNQSNKLKNLAQAVQVVLQESAKQSPEGFVKIIAEQRKKLEELATDSLTKGILKNLLDCLEEESSQNIIYVQKAIQKTLRALLELKIQSQKPNEPQEIQEEVESKVDIPETVALKVIELINALAQIEPTKKMTISALIKAKHKEITDYLDQNDPQGTFVFIFNDILAELQNAKKPEDVKALKNKITQIIKSKAKLNKNLGI